MAGLICSLVPSITIFLLISVLLLFAPSHIWVKTFQIHILSSGIVNLDLRLKFMDFLFVCLFVIANYIDAGKNLPFTTKHLRSYLISFGHTLNYVDNLLITL